MKLQSFHVHDTSNTSTRAEGTEHGPRYKQKLKKKSTRHKKKTFSILLGYRNISAAEIIYSPMRSARLASVFRFKGRASRTVDLEKSDDGVSQRYGRRLPELAAEGDEMKKERRIVSAARCTQRDENNTHAVRRRRARVRGHAAGCSEDLERRQRLCRCICISQM